MFAELAGHNESEPHLMSTVSGKPGEPSPWLAGEGRRARAIQLLLPLHHSGGVCGDGMSGRDDGLNRETCACGGRAPTDGATLATGKAGLAGAGVGVPHSSVEAPVTGVERRRGSCADASKASGEPGDGPRGIVTPPSPETAAETVRKLQRTLYRRAKSQPQWRAWSLYGELCREEILGAALKQVIENGGAPGIDGMKVEELKENPQYRQQWLEQLREELREKTYRPDPVRRVSIPKGNGKMRPLGIPTVKDRVVQTAAVMLLQPIFEADFHDKSYAYRPKRNARQAIDAIKDALLSGRREVLDADLSGYFDAIPHSSLMRLVKGRVSDGSMLRLIKEWLRAPIVEEDERSRKRKVVANRCGTPQGGVISPLLANLYLDGLDKAVNGGKQLKAVMVRYADDFVVLCRKGQGVEIRKRVCQWLERRQLRLNGEKTRVVDFNRESFDFLGFRLSWRRARSGKNYPHVEPSPKSCAKLRDAIREETAWSTQWRSSGEVTARINRRVSGWAGYFHYANSTRVFGKLDWFTRNRLRRWLWKKHGKKHGLWTEAYSDDRLQDTHGLNPFPINAPWHGSRSEPKEQPPRAGCGKSARPVR